MKNTLLSLLETTTITITESVHFLQRTSSQRHFQLAGISKPLRLVCTSILSSIMSGEKPLGYHWRSSKWFIVSTISIALFAGSFTSLLAPPISLTQSRNLPLWIPRPNSGIHVRKPSTHGSLTDSVLDFDHPCPPWFLLRCFGPLDRSFRR